MSPANPDLKHNALTTNPKESLPLTMVSKGDLPAWLSGQGERVRRWVESTCFQAEPGQICLLPDAKSGALAGVVVGVEAEPDMWAIAALSTSLPRQATYRLTHHLPAPQEERLALGWALGAYRFTRYLSSTAPAPATLVVPKSVDAKRLGATVAAITLVRDLINLPANDLGPEELAQVGVALARQYGGKASIIRGTKLAQDYPAIHAVGCGSSRPPLLLDLRWGVPKAPKLTLVGKGVVFDTGGYDLKPSAGMLLMKKDMAGAAHALALAKLIMARGLSVNLRVLVPIVENSVSGHALRPSDIIHSRSGKTIEIGNTDAEGRVILADALHEAAQDKPDWILDFATLTGARNVALGTDVPVLFSNDDSLAASLFLAAQEVQDPLWRLPLWQPYWRSMKSRVADMNNAGSAGSNGGAITAALFLEQFVPKGQPWAHIDFNAYNPSAQPGRPEGGEAMALRACFAAIEKKYG